MLCDIVVRPRVHVKGFQIFYLGARKIHLLQWPEIEDIIIKNYFTLCSHPTHAEVYPNGKQAR